jgi:hypothetical protein
MPESPIEVIRRCQRAPNKAAGNWTVLPGLSERQIQFEEANQGGPLPETLKALLRETMGIQFKHQKSEFVIGCDSGSGDLFPNCIDFMNDGCGNFWVIDTALDPNRLGPVFFVCHDPPVIFYQSRDLSEFLDCILSRKEMAQTDGAIWNAGESGGRREGEWIIFDLHNEVLGSGAPLNLYYDDDSRLERVGNSLIFRIRHRTRNWWQRFRDRWR